MTTKKVTIVGAGNTGATMAQMLGATGVADVILLDIVEGLPQGKALDIAQSQPWTGSSSQILGTNNWSDSANSDIIVVTSGVARKPGMTREDLLGTNAGIVRSVVAEATSQSPNAILVVFANPMDAMCHVALDTCNWDPARVIGQGGMLDTARYRTFISMETGASVRDVSAWVLGGHTEATMVPLVSNATVGGVPLTSLLPQKQIQALVERTKGGGAEIVGLLKTGSAFVAPAVATIEMVKSILLNENRLLPACALLDGQFGGIKDAYVGVPLLLGSDGIASIYDMPVSNEELDAIQAAGEAVKELVSVTP
jgi:malate dehydrogenase